jgi:hypothetical protein
LQNGESGREPENEDQSVNVGKDGKDVKKGGKVEIKDVKKGGKGVVEEQKVVEDKKIEFIYENLIGKTKRKHLNGFWFTKYKISIA